MLTIYLNPCDVRYGWIGRQAARVPNQASCQPRGDNSNMVSQRIEALGLDINKATINDDWREWYINYSRLLKLLSPAGQNGDGVGGFLSAWRERWPHRLSHHPSLSLAVLSRIEAMVEKTKAYLFSIYHFSGLEALPTTSKIGQGLKKMFKPSPSPPPAEELLQREVSLVEIDVWLQRHDRPPLLHSPSMRDTGIQVQVCLYVPYRNLQGWVDG